MLPLPAGVTVLLAVFLTYLLPAGAQIERSFNETCENGDQCVDFRLKCYLGRCACVKYFHWDEFSKQCLTQKDLKYMLNDMEEKFDPLGKLDTDSHHVFRGLVWTGLAVMIIGLLLAAGCLFYGCCYGRLCCCPTDKMRKFKRPACDSIRYSLPTAETTVPAGSAAHGPAGPAGRNIRPVSQGTIDFIPALYETTSFAV